jgi:murein DD-endopeptidase MepM/ murein hydrolase activator NlpD
LSSTDRPWARRLRGGAPADPHGPSASDGRSPRSDPNQPFLRRRGQQIITPWHRLERRLRAFAWTVRVDAPLAWRLAAHGAVLTLTVGVFLLTRLQMTRSAEASLIRPSTALAWAGGVGEPASLLAYQTAPGAEDTPEAPPGPAGPAGEAPAEAAAPEGFLSPGPIAEADPFLLPWEEPQSYTVQAGDTINGIASQFGIDAEALLYANPTLRANPYRLNPGDVLTILPINGVLHVTAEGDTLASLAEKYKVTVEDIVGYPPNNLGAAASLVPGTEVVVPGGQMEVRIPSYYQMVQGSGSGESAAEAWSPNSSLGAVAGSGQFYVAAYGRITQRYRRYHRAVDIANRTGTPIYAIDGGTVEAAGWLGWAGNAVVIDHGNGYKSLYAHMSSRNVERGQTVQRGQAIGGIGCTRGRGGRCTGPHLHLEVYLNGARVDPCSLGVCP